MLADDAHPAAAPAGSGLEHDGIADFVGQRLRLVHPVERALAARHDRRARRLGHSARLGLVAHEPDGLGRGPDERDAAGPAHLGERGVFREEPVAGVDRLALRDRGGRDDARDVQIALPRLRRARCRSTRRRASRRASGRRRSSTPPRCGCPCPGTFSRSGGRSLRDWRSGSCETRVGATGAPAGTRADHIRRAARSRPAHARCARPPWPRSRSSASSPR